MKRTVLIVNSDESERVKLTDILKEKYDIISADNPDKATAELRAGFRNISAVVLSITTRRANEFAFVSIMRDDIAFRSIPVVVTADGDDAMRERAASYGADAFIRKPYTHSLLHSTLENAIRLREASATLNTLWHDKLTGLLNREAFFEEAERLIQSHNAGYYVLSCLDVDNFKLINDSEGTEKGDLVLKHIADVISNSIMGSNGLACRFTADRFAILYPADLQYSLSLTDNHAATMMPPCLNHAIRIRIGRYLAEDTAVSVSDMYDRAMLAQESIKGRYDVYIADYSEDMRASLIKEQKIVSDMEDALRAGEFEAWFQPQYNHATGVLIGAEALVRWRKDGRIIPPYEFIPVFERNGFIYEIDKYIWRTVCAMLRRRIDAGKSALPVSVNISRFDVFHKDFLDTVCGLVKEFDLPADLLRLEITESAFSESTKGITEAVNELINRGFTVEIDDFGSGYSSLNTLKDVPASILKLDMKFFENTKNQQRGGNIVESVVRMAKWLGMAVIAEGVEDKEQADYLKSIGCYYIQGYFYARPMPGADYERLLDTSDTEPKLTRLKTLNMLDNSEFWNPRSMETLIFNSYVGGACIFEYNGQKSELLRVNEQYTRELGGLVPPGVDLENSSIVKFLNSESKGKLLETIDSAAKTEKEAACEIRLEDNGHFEYLRVTVRLIARAAERGLFYCVILNVTKPHELEEQLRAIVNSINGGVTATVIRDGEPEFVVVNNRFYENLGFASKEQYEREVKDKYANVHPLDRERVIRQFESEDGGKDRYTMEYRIIRRDGAVRYIRNNISVIKLFGVKEPVQLSVANDVTELRAAQDGENAAADKLSTVLNHAGNGITAIALKDEPEFIFANDKYYEIIGFSRSEYAAIMKNDLFAPVHPEDREELRKKVTELNSALGSDTLEYRVIRSDGITVWVRSVITITSLAGVKEPVQIAVFSDISAEKEANEQLRFLNESAHDILARPDSDIAVGKTLEKLLSYFEGDRAYVMEINRDTALVNNTYEKCADGVKPEKDNLQNVPLYVSEMWFSALERDEFIVIKDVSAITDDDAELRSMLSAQGISSLIIAPLNRDGTLVGFVGIDNPRKTTDKLERLRALGDYIAVLLTRRDLSAKISNDAEMLKALMDDTPGAFVRMKLMPNGAFVPVYSNNGFTELVGMSHEELHEIYGNDVLSGVHPEDREIVKNAGGRMVADGEAESARFRVRKGNGEDIWLTLYGRMTRDVSGDTYLNVYFSDATKQINEEEKQRELLDNLPCGAALYEYDGQRISVIHINKSYWELVGREPVDYANASIVDMVHPDDRRMISAEIEAALRQKRNIAISLRIKCGEGEYRAFRIDAKITKSPDGNHRLFASYTPLSGQTLSVQEMLPVALSTMMSSSEDLSFVMDKDLHYICCSRSDAEFLGLDSERDIIGMTDYDLFDAELAAHLIEDDERILKTGEALVDRTEQIAAHDGSIRVVSVSKYPIRDANGVVIGLYGVSRDITAQREKESQLELLTSTIPGGLAAFSISENGLELLYFNDGFYQFSGHTREEYAALVRENPLALVLEEDRPQLVQMIHEFSSNKKDGHINGCVYRCRTKSGGYKWMSMKTVLSKMSGDRYVVNVVQLDITEQQEEKERLRVSEEVNRLAIELSGNIITRFDVKSRTLTLPDLLNPMFVLPQVLQNVPEEQIELERISPDTADEYRRLFEGILNGESKGSVTFKQESAIGWRWLEAQYTTVFSSTGEPVSAVISFKDVTEELEKEVVYNKWQQSLNERDENTFTLFRCNLSKNSSFDSWEGKLLDIIFDKQKDTFDERTEEFLSLVYPEDRELYKSFMRSDTLLAEYYRGHRAHTLEFRDITANGDARWLRLTVELVEYPGSKDIEVYLMYENIDEEKKAALLALERSERDVLTGVLNRAAFTARMKEIMFSSKPGTKHVFMMLDIDSFKSINDTYGHAVGDEVIKGFAGRIRAVLRCDDLIARPGGDEFFVFMKNVPRAGIAAEKAKQMCSFDVVTGAGKVPVTSSIGIAMVPEDGRSFETLYKLVDEALYRTKSNGKHGYTFASDKNGLEE